MPWDGSCRDCGILLNADTLRDFEGAAVCERCLDKLQPKPKRGKRKAG